MEVGFSVFLCIVRSIRSAFFTLVFVAVAVGAAYLGLPGGWTALVLVPLWVFLVFFPWIRAFIDWRYDVLVVTTEEVVIIDQSSIFHASIRQMNLDNIASVSAETMFLNLLSFGKLHFELKEGVGKSISLPYIPQAQRVSSIISDAMVTFQRRRAAMMGAAAQGARPDDARRAADAAVPQPQRITDRTVEAAEDAAA